MSLTADQKQFILNNINEALLAVHATPEQVINLSTYRTSCGTHYCLAGILTETPHFQALGWDWSHLSLPAINGSDVDRGEEPADAHLGARAWNNLFASRGNGDLDFAILKGQQGFITDKDLAICRLVEQRKLVEAM